MTFQVGSKILGRWEVRRVLRGGLGVVYLVWDPAARRAMAVKSYLGDKLESPDVVERFRLESFAWSQISEHANVVLAEEFHVINGRPYLFLEYVDGGDLSEWIGTPRLTQERALRFAMQFCDGMEHAYSQGLTAHRDVKPQNCMLTSSGEILKITDFGLARVADTASLLAHRQDEATARWLADLLQGKVSEPPKEELGLTGAGKSMGTATHMPPEQWKDAASCDHRADIYSFGVMLVQMLSGHLPFKVDSIMALAWHHAAVDPPRLDVDQALNSLIQRCMAKDPAQRPQSFLEVRHELSVAYAQVTGQAPPPPATGPPPQATALNDRACCLINLGLLDEARELLAEVLRSDPACQAAWINLGATLRRLGNPHDSVTSLERALQLGEDAAAWNELGLTLSKLHDPRAESCWQRAVQLDPHHPLAWNNMGIYYAGQGHYGQSLTCFREAQRLSPRRAEIYIGAGMALFQLDRIQEALGHFEVSLRLNPHDARVWNYAGMCMWSLANYAAAAEYFQRASQEDPTLAEVWMNLGRWHLQEKRLEQSQALLERALQLNPEVAQAWYLLASALIYQGRYQDAVTALDRSLELDSQDANAWFNRAQALLQLKQREAARASFKHAHECGHPQAAHYLPE